MSAFTYSRVQKDEWEIEWLDEDGRYRSKKMRGTEADAATEAGHLEREVQRIVEERAARTDDPIVSFRVYGVYRDGSQRAVGSLVVHDHGDGIDFEIDPRFLDSKSDVHDVTHRKRLAARDDDSVDEEAPF